MQGATVTATQVIGNGLERDILMLPSHPQPSTSKRKTEEDSNPLTNAAKRLKKSATSNKRKLVGEEQPGGLVIIRAPSTRSPSEDTHAPPRTSTLAPNHLTNGESSKPASKKLKTDVQNAYPKPKERDKPPNFRTDSADFDEDAQQNEDVRQMQSETDTLRRRSRPPETINPAFQFPPPETLAKSKSQKPSSQSQERGRIREMSFPLPLQETPEIRRNKLMRGDSVVGKGPTRRKSSLSRGKRISSTFENTGVIAQPHTAVRDSSFYKHIDVELPEPQRAQQLLIWCSHRAMSELIEKNTQASTTASSSHVNGKDPGKDPPLSSANMMLLKSVEESVVRMLAEKKIDTNVYSPPDDGEGSSALKENEGNARNRAREARFNAHIQKLKLEDERWTEVGSSYNAFRSQVLAELEERRKEFPSAKAKGKQRLDEDDEEEGSPDVDLWDISEQDLPEHFRGSEGLDLARSIVKGEHGRHSTLNERIADLEWTADRLHTLAHSALKTTRIAETDLNRRFAMLNSFLAARSHTLIPAAAPSSGALSSYLPPTIARPPPTTDPQDLLRAMSRVDITRPQAQVGDAARRAVREVHRANDAYMAGGLAERKLTDVPPPTPRKPPGTPRRATTPGRR